ncbi:MAG: hypothetical protein IBX46_06530 [Desulfuromonadales bacterium]|nr:hypothetical protein [Desulfuromonadales bacterium]
MLRNIFIHLQSALASSGPARTARSTTLRHPIVSSALLVAFALLGLLFLGSATSRAASLSPPVTPVGGLPSELGTIVYQKHPERPLQVFIIGNSHRSSASGKNGSQTVPAQVQTYRIAEWLIRQHQVELLLPEGFFGRQDRTEIVEAIVGHDGAALEAALADTSTFINADLLLHRNYGIALHQIEDRSLYRNARDHLHAGLEGGYRLPASFSLELEYLQERRSAAILQNLPAVINAAYHQGEIVQPRAILTIGMAHLDEIIKFLEMERMEILAPPVGTSGFQDYRETLDLLAQVGVTVIVPRALHFEGEGMNPAALASQADRKKPGVFHPGEI